jgi:TRAP transporter TAXI family solute receptor
MKYFKAVGLKSANSRLIQSLSKGSVRIWCFLLVVIALVIGLSLIYISGSSDVSSDVSSTEADGSGAVFTEVEGMPTEGIPEDYVMLIGGSSMEGTFYQFIVGSVELVDRYGSGGWKVMPFATGGSAEGFARLETGECNANHAAGLSYVSAVEGTYGFDHPFDGDLYLLQCDIPYYITICTRANSPYNSLADLKGKKVSIGGAINTSAYGVSKRVLNSIGIDAETYFDVNSLSPAESMAALAEGTIDALIISNGPGGIVTQIAASSTGLKLIPFTDEEIERATAANPVLISGMIPGGTYIGNDEDVKTVYDRGVLVATLDLPENIAYQYIKIVSEHHDEIAAINENLFGDATPQMTIDTYYGVIPLHPGAEKYYREIGLID